MSEVNGKAKLDAAIEKLQYEYDATIRYAKGLEEDESEFALAREQRACVEWFPEAIRILSSWPKYQPLIEAAGKVDTENAVDALGNVTDYVLNGRGYQSWVRFETELRALLSAIPAKEKEG
jgi:hypothetical protein